MKVTAQFQAKDGHARTGLVHTPHGTFAVPGFMPVASRGAIRGVPISDMRTLGCDIILANAFHLYLRPGDEVIGQMGGLRTFMGWDGPTLTDSGGYQVFSLAKLRKITPEGIVFQSPYDGSTHTYTPELCVRIQANLGSTFMMQLDELHPYGTDTSVYQHAWQTTLDWYRRSQQEMSHFPQAGTLVPILQGGFSEELRREHLYALMNQPNLPPIIAIGGLAVGEPQPLFADILGHIMNHIPKDKVVYLMGIGKPQDVLHAIALGVDMFDCVLPTRNGRNGQVFTFQGKYNIRNHRFHIDTTPLEEGCGCPTCTHYSRAAIHHFFRVHEMNGPIAVSLHNLFFFFAFFSRIREAIRSGSLHTFTRAFCHVYDKNGALSHPTNESEVSL